MELLTVCYMAVSHAERQVSFAATLQDQPEVTKLNIRWTMLNEDADNLLAYAKEIRVLCQSFAGYAPAYLRLQTDHPAPEEDSSP
jgi:hypothetical protein